MTDHHEFLIDLCNSSEAEDIFGEIILAYIVNEKLAFFLSHLYSFIIVVPLQLCWNWHRLVEMLGCAIFESGVVAGAIKVIEGEDDVAIAGVFLEDHLVVRPACGQPMAEHHRRELLRSTFIAFSQLSILHRLGIHRLMKCAQKHRKRRFPTHDPLQRFQRRPYKRLLVRIADPFLNRLVRDRAIIRPCIHWIKHAHS